MKETKYISYEDPINGRSFTYEQMPGVMMNAKSSHRTITITVIAYQKLLVIYVS